MLEHKRVVVTGIGPLTSIGFGKDAFWDNLLKKKTNITKEKKVIDTEVWDEYHIHRIKNFNISDFGLEQGLLNWVKDWKEGTETIDLLYMIASIKLALDDSKLEYKPFETNDFGLVVTHENMNLEPMISKMNEFAFAAFKNAPKSMTKKEFYEKSYQECLKTAYDTQTFIALFHLAKVFNVSQHSLFVCNACASGLYAIETASEMIKSNNNSTVIVAASDCPDIYKYLWFRDLGIYSKDGITRPFCKDSNGFIFGDAGVALVLEELEHAQNRNATIYAEYLGGGFNLESWQITRPKIGSSSYQSAISKCFEQSGTTRKEIDFLVPHGVGSHVTDYYESKAITDIFGINPKRPLITTFKPYIGHTLGASALIETAILLLSLKNNKILPTLNTDNINPRYNVSLVKNVVDANLKTAMKICCAFAGFNAAAIFRNLDL